MVRFDKKWFNPLYFIINGIIKDESVRIVLIYGGKSSSKTVSICQSLSKECYVKASNIIAYRKESNIIPTTLKKSFNLSIDTARLYPAFERQDRRYLCHNQGNELSEIVLKGLDDQEKAKGIESYKYVYLDELNHFEFAEYEQFNLSLRGIPGQKLFGSWNPVDENSWVKTDLVDKYDFLDTDQYGVLPSDKSFVKKSECGKVALIKTTYLDNYWIVGSPCGTYGYRDENLISEYESLKERNYESYRVNVLGEWGIKDPESLFAKDFKEKIHYTKSRSELYDPNQDIFLCWDFNIQNTCLVIQNPQDNVINVLQEYHIKGYDLEMLANLIKKEYEGHFITINGDAAGHSRSALTSGNATAYDILKGLFGLSWEQFHVPRSNPSHRNSRLLTNLIFKTCQVNIALECVELKNDLIAVKVDDSGSMDPYKKKNPNRSHWLDPLRYHFNAHHSNILTLLNK